MKIATTSVQSILLTILAISFVIMIALMITGCTTTPTAPTDRQQVIANAVEDVISIGLVPVLSKNPTYLESAKTVATMLALGKDGEINPNTVDAFLAQVNFAESDRKLVAALVCSAWATYQKRYSEQVSKTVRPDAALFLRAVSNGILNACAAVPR